MQRPKHDVITFKHVFSTILGWVMFIAVNSVLIALVPVLLLISLLFDRDKKIFSYIIKIFYYIFYFLNFVQNTRFERNGLKSPKKGERRIYVINHASMFDSIIMCVLPGALKSLMKEAYAKIPVIGWIAVAAGNIVLKDNISPGEHYNLYMRLTEMLERGSVLIIFPEGTKSKDSKLGRFYPGSFKIAQDTKADIIPVVFDTWNVIRPDGLWIRDVRPAIRVLDTIAYNKIKDMPYKQISDMVRIRMLEGLISVRDTRREEEKNYYRHIPKYEVLDDEMRDQLIDLRSKYSDKYEN